MSEARKFRSGQLLRMIKKMAALLDLEVGFEGKLLKIEEKGGRVEILANVETFSGEAAIMGDNFGNDYLAWPLGKVDDYEGNMTYRSFVDCLCTLQNYYYFQEGCTPCLN